MDLPPLKVDEEMPIIKKGRMSTGVKDLDIIMEGGYVNPGNIMLLGPTCAEKTAFGYHFISAGVKSKNECMLFLTSDSSPATIKEKASSIDLVLPEETNFIDCYSSTISSGAKDSAAINVSGPQALEDISFAISDVINKNAGKKMRVVVGSLSTLLLYNPKDSMLKFLQLISGRLRNAGATTLFLIEEGVHDKQLLSMVEHVMDEKYAIIDKGGSYEFSIPEFSISLPIKIGPNGIMIL